MVILNFTRILMNAPKVLMPWFTVYPAADHGYYAQQLYNIIHFRVYSGQGPHVLYQQSVLQWEIDEIHPKKQSLVCIKMKACSIICMSTLDDSKSKRSCFPDCSTHRLVSKAHGHYSVHKNGRLISFNPINCLPATLGIKMIAKSKRRRKS